METNTSSSNERKCSLSSVKKLRGKGSKRKYKSGYKSPASSSGSSTNERKCNVSSAKILRSKGSKRKYKSGYKRPASSGSSTNERKCNLSSAKILRSKGSKRKYKSSHKSPAFSSGSLSNERKCNLASAKNLRSKGSKRKYKSCHKSSASSSDSSESDFSYEKVRKKHKSSCQRKKLHEHIAQQKPSSEHHSTVSVFQKYYADVLKLLKMVSERTLHQLYSKHLIPIDLISAKRAQILKSLMITVQVEPDTFYDVIKCLEEELQTSGILQHIKEELETMKVSGKLTIEGEEKSVQRYKSFLQSLYNRSEVVTDDKLFISPCNKFIDLILLKQNGDFSKLEDQREKACSKVISLESIIEPMNKSIFLIGESGMGKSTAAFEICRHWDDWRNLAKFRIVLLLKLRESRVQSMTEIITDLFYHRHKALSKAVAKEALKSEGDGFLLIFDGFDELPESVVEDQKSLLMELIVGKCLPKSVRFITSRPKALYLKRKLFPKMQVVELQGFTEENGSKYLEVAFQSKPTLLKHLTDHVLTNPIFNFILTVPINCAILASIYEDMYKSVLLPKTMTELYYKLVLVLIRRFLIEQGQWTPETKLVQSILKLPKPIFSQFNSVSKLAYDGYMEVKSIQVVFTDNDVGEGFCHLGLMNEISELYVSEGIRKQYSFFHMSLQEFLAAWHAVSCPSLDFKYFKSILIFGIRGRSDQSNFFIDCDGFRLGTLDMTYEPFIPFLFGHSRVVCNEELMKFLCDDIVRSSSRMKRTVLGSIFECQKPELCVELDGMHQDITLCSRLDMYFFAYILQHSPCNWFVRAYCSFDTMKDILIRSNSILGSVQNLDLRCRMTLGYSELQYLPLHNLQQFTFTVASPKQCQNVSVLVSKLSSLDSIDVNMKLSQKFCTSTNDVFFRSIQNDYLLFRSCLSLASLGSLTLTFYDLTKEGVRCLRQLISFRNIQEVKLMLLNQDLTDYGITSQTFNPLLEGLIASNLESLKINFGHDVLSYSLGKSAMKDVRVYFDDIDLLYKYISVLNPNLHHHSSKMKLEIRREFCEATLDMPKLSKALRHRYCDTERHTRSKSLSLLDDFYEDADHENSDASDDGSENEYESTSQRSSSASSYYLQDWNSYSSGTVSERSWKQSCPDLMYIQEINTLHPVLCKALGTSNLYYSNSSRSRGYDFMSFRW